MSIHLISKANIAEHLTIDVPPSDSPLKPSSVRIRSSLLSLTSNNLSYALLGTYMHWWDTCPVPLTLPPPYNNPSDYGIVPAWGLATVLDSTIPSLTPGTILWGFWPTGSHAFDLTLTPAELPGHYKEVSAHRKDVLPLYNRYRVFDTQGNDLSTFGWDAAVGTIFVAGYLLAEYMFTPDPASHPAIHPSEPGALEWKASDADLSKSIFVSLGASTKTARSTAFNFFARSPGTEPLGLLQFTSSVDALSEAAAKGSPNFAVGTLPYSDVELAGKWIAGLELETKIERVVVADFGSRDGVLVGVVEDIRGNERLKGVEVVVLAVGGQQKVYSFDEIMAEQAMLASLNRVQMNTSPAYEEAIKLVGAEEFYRGVQERWNSWLENREAAAPDLRLVWGGGVAGEEGIEGCWGKLCGSKVRPEEAHVFRI
ncbi:DUF2855 family protein [Aspergillus mulundensis]|uniref:Uncharacterized protein n=1 Tax=Aspergillus mulundensis TaxID=1810919 RepID=A0A3D8R4K6_9EURO|nr:Uncharacterized protein DSM5745_08658 [Aspergillus mulundensis]RDW68898.1 Uncharacterized protein DSM5745_08658 [Aspergillus mulundensis]